MKKLVIELKFHRNISGKYVELRIGNWWYTLFAVRGLYVLEAQ
jgi:hypothetical protein